MQGLPEGFVLEGNPSGLPDGFVLEDASTTQPEQPQGDSFIKDVRDVAGEFAAGANRVVANTLDFIGPDTVNAGLRLAGSDKQVPTLRETLAPTGIEGGFMEEGLARDVVAGAGGAMTAAGGFMQVPRNLATASGAAAEFLGVGSAKVPATVAPVVGQKLALLRNTGDANTAGVMLDQAGNVVKDKLAKKTMWQGFEPGFVAMVKSSTPDTQHKMSAMLDIVEKGKKNYGYAANNRPLDVVGDSVLNRIKVVREANAAAVRRLDDVADTLMGAQVDTAPAVDKFLNTLTKMGMQYNPETGRLMLIKGSSTQDMPKVHKQAMRVLRRLQTTRKDGVLDGYDVHVMKKWIDNNVDYTKDGGKGKSHAIGALDNAIKGLRHDLDGVLDAQFPQYDKINTQYAETRTVLDEVMGIAGKKFDENADSAALTMGSLSRRFLSNAQSNGYLRDAVSKLDDTARKYIQPGTDLVQYMPSVQRKSVTPAMLENDDLIGLVRYSDELDGMFGAASKTSLLGDIEKGVNTASGGIGAAVIEGSKWAAKKAARINEERAIKSMRELLNRAK